MLNLKINEHKKLMNNIKNVTVYCASSAKCDNEYIQSASELGKLLAEQKINIWYGGGKIGLMGALADSALLHGGSVYGVIPDFMKQVEWGNNSITELITVKDMHERKRMMMEKADAIIVLPGGCGTFDELMEAITWKRLGLIIAPLIIVNVKNYFQPLIELLNLSITENFMREEHSKIWTIVDNPKSALQAAFNEPLWHSDAIKFAAV